MANVKGIVCSLGKRISETITEPNYKIIVLIYSNWC